MFYAVCTSCTFLRAYSSVARVDEKQRECPACGSKLITRKKAGRFEPTYVAKVAMELHNSPELNGPSAG